MGDFNKVTCKGSGWEITKGLIDPIDGTVVAKRDNEFELIIDFK